MIGAADLALDAKEEEKKLMFQKMFIDTIIFLIFWGQWP